MRKVATGWIFPESDPHSMQVPKNSHSQICTVFQYLPNHWSEAHRFSVFSRRGDQRELLPGRNVRTESCRVRTHMHRPDVDESMAGMNTYQHM